MIGRPGGTLSIDAAAFAGSFICIHRSSESPHPQWLASLDGRQALTLEDAQISLLILPRIGSPCSRLDHLLLHEYDMGHGRDTGD
jgi:hypothetical protein